MVSASASEICAGVTVPTNKPSPTEKAQSESLARALCDD